MICSKCGAKIEEDKFFCGECGKAVQLVPDYSLADEMITNEIPESEVFADLPDPDVTEAEAVFGDTDPVENVQPSVRRKKRRRKKNRMKYAVLTFVGAVILIAGVCLWLSRSMKVNSYSYQMEQAEQKFDKKDYEKALDHAGKAADLNQKKTEPYLLMSDIWLALKEPAQAARQLEQAISIDNMDKTAYEKLLSIYENEEEFLKITQLLSDAPSTIRDAFSEYIADAPMFSEEEMTHNTEIEVELFVEEGDVYYTLDNSTPDEERGILYEKAIELSEGSTTIRAITINEKGIASSEVKMTYEIIFDIPDAPSISPASGTYTDPIKIEISLGPGETAYYTMDGKDPDTNAKQYTGAITLSENGDYIFSAIVVGGSNKASGITRRSYDIRIQNVVEPEVPETREDEGDQD